MKIEQYSILAARTLKSLGNREFDLAHMSLGIGGEAGEVQDIVKKHIAYDKDLDLGHLAEEVGDLVFYINGLLIMADLTWGDVLSKNIAKLEARYPGFTFDADKAINRDKDAEQAAMAKV